MFHVKHRAVDATPDRSTRPADADSRPAMFHVKHRGWRLAVAAVAIATLTACTGIEAPAGWAAPVRAGEVVVVRSAEGTLSGIRLVGSNEHEVAWTFPQQDQSSNGITNFVRGLFTSASSRPNYSAIYATPRVETVDNQPRLYVASYAGDVVALNPADGKPVGGWPERVNVGGHVAATPAFDGKKLYLGTGRGDVRTVDAASGSVGVAVVGTEARVWSEPLLAGGTLYVSSLDRTVRAIDPNTKAVRWSAQVDGAVAGNPVLAGDLLIVPTLQSQVIALDARSGERRWAFTGDAWFWARPLVAGDVVYAPGTDGTVYALELATGKERWRSTAVRGEVRAAPVLSGGALLVASRKGVVAALDPATGAERWTRQLEKTAFLADPLVLESGVLYVAENGTLYRVTAPDQGTVDVLVKRG